MAIKDWKTENHRLLLLHISKSLYSTTIFFPLPWRYHVLKRRGPIQDDSTAQESSFFNHHFYVDSMRFPAHTFPHFVPHFRLTRKKGIRRIFVMIELHPFRKSEFAYLILEFVAIGQSNTFQFWALYFNSTSQFKTKIVLRSILLSSFDCPASEPLLKGTWSVGRGAGTPWSDNFINEIYREIRDRKTHQH